MCSWLTELATHTSLKGALNIKSLKIILIIFLFSFVLVLSRLIYVKYVNYRSSTFNSLQELTKTSRLDFLVEEDIIDYSITNNDSSTSILVLIEVAEDRIEEDQYKTVWDNSYKGEEPLFNGLIPMLEKNLIEVESLIFNTHVYSEYSIKQFIGTLHGPLYSEIFVFHNTSEGIYYILTHTSVSFRLNIKFWQQIG